MNEEEINEIHGLLAHDFLQEDREAEEDALRQQYGPFWRQVLYDMAVQRGLWCTGNPECRCQRCQPGEPEEESA